jgi:hypothetical protein
MLHHYISPKLKQESYAGLWPAAKNGSESALNMLSELAALNNDVFWLEKAASLQNLQAMLALADLSNGSDKTFWWQQAAIIGHAPSQFELSFLVDSTLQRVRYLEQAAMNEHIPAIIALSKFYYENRDASNALRWLTRAVEYDKSSTFKLARMLFREGFEAQARAAFNDAVAYTPIAKNYVHVLNDYKQTTLSSLISQPTTMLAQCAQQLQFVATSLDSAVQAINIKHAFERDERLSMLPICISSIIWLAPNELECDLADGRKACDLSSVAKQSFVPTYTHLVFFLEEGKAYVNDGAMFLAQDDTYPVFVHELAHFVGFVDEYSLPTALAQQHCYKNVAPNLLVSNDEILYEHEKYQRWQRYQDQLILLNSPNNTENISTDKHSDRHIKPLSLDIAPSLACESLDLAAFKPSNQLTFMEYHDTRNIPPIYILMWKDLLKQRHHDIAVAALFMKSAQQSGNQDLALYWSAF